MNEKSPEEAERGNDLRMSSPGKRVARKLGAERMCPAEYRCSMYPGMAMSRSSWRQRSVDEKGRKLRASEVCACA